MPVVPARRPTRQLLPFAPSRRWMPDGARDSFWSAPQGHESGSSAEFFRIFFRGIFGCGTSGVRSVVDDVRVHCGSAPCGVTSSPGCGACHPSETAASRQSCPRKPLPLLGLRRSPGQRQGDPRHSLMVAESVCVDSAAETGTRRSHCSCATRCTVGCTLQSACTCICKHRNACNGAPEQVR